MSKIRRNLSFIFIGIGVSCVLSIFLVRAANPTSGSISPTSSPVVWDGTAAGGAYNGESTCVDGVNCDTFTLTVAGTPADWAGKRVQVTMTWVVLANDYDLYIHKTDNNGPVVDQSAHGAPSNKEVAYIEPDNDGTGVFTVHIGYFTGAIADEPHCVATVVPSFPSPPPPPPLSTNWTINSHGECCEGNLAAAGNNTFVLLPVLVQGNKILKSSDGGHTWAQKYPPAPASVPFGIEGDMQAWGTDVIFFGTELGVAITAHSDDYGETFVPVQNPIASAGNDQAWSYLAPFGDMRPGGRLPTDEPYVLAGWMRIGASLIFSFDGGLTYPLQTPLAGDDGSGPLHVVCRNSAHAPNNAGDTRVANADFAKHKAGRHGTWGTDRKFYWTEPADGTNPGDRDLYVCSTGDFGVNWAGVKHPVSFGPASDFVVSHSAFDNNGTFYVLHGDKLYVSFNKGESFAFVHTLPRYGDARRSDSGSDQFFVVDCGTIHLGILADAGEGRGNVFYLRGQGVDTANPIWDEELVDVVDNDRLDFIYIVLNGSGIPTVSYTKPTAEVTTASRNTPMPVYGGSSCSIAALNAVSRKFHNGTPYDVPLPFSATKPGIECRTGGATGDHTIVVTFPTTVSVIGNGTVKAQVTSGTGQVGSGGTANGNAVTVSGSVVTVPLTNVVNAQRLSVTIFGVKHGSNVGDVAIQMGVLNGDSTADGTVNSADVSQTKSRSGQTISSGNFRSDVTVEGTLNSADVSLVKSKSGTALP